MDCDTCHPLVERQSSQNDSDCDSNAHASLKQPKKNGRKRVLCSSDDDDDSPSTSRHPQKARKTVATVAPVAIAKHSSPKKRRKGRHSGEGVGGTIVKMHLSNFMCHDNICLEFNKHVNFITGRNGSGKSAVLAGLVLGLGGSASAMGRGRAVKEYIKTGKDCSTITITLVNTGPDAYKPELYGNRITVERTLMRSGTNKYKLMDQNERTVSNCHKDVLAINDRLSIMLDNPVSIVTQEVSREFLQQFKPKDLYQFFMTSTKLKQMAHDLSELNRHQRNSDEKLGHKVKSLARVKREIEELKKKEQSHKDIAEGEDRLVAYQMQGHYAKLKKMKESREQLHSNVKFAHQEVERLNGRINENQEHLQETQKEEDAKLGELSSIAERTEEATARLKESQKETAEWKAKCDRLEITKVEKEGNIGRWNRDIGALNQMVKDLDKRGDQSEIINNFKDKIQQSEARLIAEQTNNDEVVQQLDRVNAEIGGLSNEINEAKSEVSSMERELADRRGERSRLDNKSGGLGVYGRDYEQLNKLVHQCTNSFTKVPKGPLGFYIKLKDPKAGVAVEKCLGTGYLKGYICDNYDDAQRLKGLIGQAFRGGWKPAYSVSKFVGRVHSVAPYRPHCNTPTILECLDINDADVANALIDNKSIESTLLFSDQEQLIHAMRDNPPAKTNRAYDYEGNTANPRPRYVCYMNRDTRGCQLLGTSATERIEQLESYITTLTQSINPIKQTLKQLCHQNDILQKDQRKLQDADMKGKNDIQQLQRRLKKLNEDLAEKERDVGQDTGIYRTELNEKRAELEEMKAEFETFCAPISGLKESLAAAKCEVRTRKQEVDGIVTSAQPLKLKIEDLKSLKAKIMQKLRRNEDQLKQIRERLPEKEKEYKDINQSIEEHQALVEAKLPEGKCLTDYKTNLTQQKIHEMFDKLKRELATANEQLGNIHEIQRQLEEKNVVLARKSANLKQARKLNKELSEAILQREKMYLAVKSYMALTLKFSFMYNMTARGYKGILSVDFKEQEINISADMTKSIKKEYNTTLMSQRPRTSLAPGQSRIKDLKGLSGGERSFTTVCFLVALWDNMDAPFRCVDEFDVFMDMVNRTLSLNMLLGFATGNNDRQKMHQFIILTPLDSSTLPDSTSVSIFKMQDPNRIQK